MNQDTIWQIIRYGLIAGFGFLTGKGYITSEQATTVIGALGTMFPIIWGLYVKANTKSVPAATAARSDVPTVSSATGSIQP
jgi:hypothetical protein